MKLNKFIGIPYQAKGRDWSGVDCMGLVYLFYRDILGLKIPTYVEDYLTSHHRQSVSDAITTNLKNWQKVDKPKFGDLLVFNILGLETHVGVYISNNDFLHGFMRCDSCIERLNSVTWDRRLTGVYRWTR